MHRKDENIHCLIDTGKIDPVTLYFYSLCDKDDNYDHIIKIQL